MEKFDSNPHVESTDARRAAEELLRRGLLGDAEVLLALHAELDGLSLALSQLSLSIYIYICIYTYIYIYRER